MSPFVPMATGGTLKRQRPELWNVYSARIHPGETIRVFPLSLTGPRRISGSISPERISPSANLYFAVHDLWLSARDNGLWSTTSGSRSILEKPPRFAWFGSGLSAVICLTAAIESTATTSLRKS